MSAFHDNMLLGASGQQGYQISRSVRLRSSATAYLSRTAGTPTNQNRWTWSGWIKRGALTGGPTLLSGGSTANDYQAYIFNVNSTNELYCIHAIGGTNQSDSGSVTTALYRDPSAWYHFVIVYDSANATAANRYIVYVNGVQQAVSLYPSLNEASYINASGYTQYIGQRGYSSLPYDGYMTEINFIDGQALTPSSFGQVNSVTGVWQPIKYTGTYGNNGFYLNFSDNSNNTAATIGKDYSGNGNNWTPNNISVTAGVTYDSMIDVPTLYADGGNGRGNYATFNPLLYATASGYRTLSNGNLTSVGNSATNNGNDYSTISTTTTGKWYAEFTVTGSSGIYPEVGIIDINYTNNGAGQVGTTTNSACYLASGSKVVANVTTSYGSSFTTNDVIGVAVDCTNGTLTFYKNNVSQGTAYSWTGGTIDFFFSTAVYQSGTGWNANFGQRPFTYTPPTGFKALNTQNLPTPTISNGATVMAATTYTGTGATASISNAVNGVSMKPDFVWIKDRSAARSHRLFDTVRGATKALFSDATDAETTLSTDLTAFNSNGFSLGAGLGSNANTETFVGWQWQAGQGSTSSNTSGSITSTVSVNATAGFSIVTWAGSGAAGTIGHGLNAVPAMLITKNRSTGTNANWVVWQKNLTGGNTVTDAYYMYLNGTNGQNASGGVFYKGTDITSTTFGFQSGNSNVNASGNNYVAYCWAEVAGYSKFGSYTGNNTSDGPFVYCGFRPRWIMIKSISTGGSATYGWAIFDTSRENYNINRSMLVANVADAENTTIEADIDILSNGFKLRYSANYDNGANTYIFAAFAEVPFRNSLAR